jgi:hypothetical protein
MSHIRFIFLKAVIFIMAFNFMYGQTDFLGHTIQFTPSEKPDRSIDLKQYRSVILKKYEKLITDSLYLKEYVNEVVNYKWNFLNSNMQYENLQEMTTYLNKITALLGFDKIFDKNVEIKIVREPSFNAYAYEDGIIYVNIGLLANVDNEAEIAAVLSHELGHIVFQHSYKRFLHEKKFFQNQGNINVFTHNFTHAIASSINKKSYSDNLVEQEEEADQHAFACLKKSNFDYTSFTSLFRKFNLIDDKFKGAADYKRSWFYFKTHPNSEKRLKQASAFSSGGGGENKFPIDSTLFYKIRQQAIDETINIYFEKLNFDDCLELAFKQHLFFPDDQFYLFYITECTRRLLLSDDAYGERLFISGNYNPGFCRKDQGLTPACILTGGQVKTNDPRVNNSIFNKLEGALLLMNENEVKKIVNHRLIQKDTVKLLTYIDAFIYFTRLNHQMNFSFNNYSENKKKFSAGELDLLLANHSDKKLYYECLPSVVNQYVTRNDGKGKVLWVISDFNYIKHTTGIFSGGISTGADENYNKLIGHFNSHNELQQNFAKIDDLNFNEYNKIKDFISSVSDHLPAAKNGRMKKRKVIAYKMSDVMPELYTLLYMHYYKKVIFSNIAITVDEKSVFGETSQQSVWNINNYIFDGRSNTITCYGGNILDYEGAEIFGSDYSCPQGPETAYFDLMIKCLNQEN